MSLTLRLALTYLLATLVGLLLLGAGLLTLAGRYLADRGERELGAQAELYAALLGELAATPAQLQPVVAARPPGELLPRGTATRVFSPAGALLAGDPALGPFPSRPALTLVRPPFPLPASQVEGRRYAARLIAGPTAPLGVVELSRDATADTQLLQTLSRLTLQAALVAALVMAAVSVFVARTIARPVVQLAARAQALAARFGAASRDASVARLRPENDELIALERSITALEAALQKRMARIAELEQTRAHFYRGVSHELRTPLTAISSTLENLADSVPPPQRPAITMLEGETARLSRLVDDLLRSPDNGTLATLSRTPVDLSTLVAEVATLLGGRARRAGVRLEQPPSPTSVLLADRDRLKQALLNLVDNAVRVTPPGGVVLMRVEVAGAVVRLVVEDNGPGVDPTLGEQIWQRGVRGPDPTMAGAAGLGLPLVREIATAHGGRAYLDAQAGPGARFVIELPTT